FGIGAVVSGLVVSSLSYLLFYKYGLAPWGVIWKSILIGLVSGAGVLIFTFIFFLLIAHDLEDPPRRIRHRQQKRILKALRQYDPHRVVTIHLYHDVEDAEIFGRDIRRVLGKAGWSVDMGDADLISEREHSEGL